MKILAILAAAAMSAAPSAPASPLVDGPFMRLQAGQVVECANQTGCLVMTTEALQSIVNDAVAAGVRAGYTRGRDQACKPTL